MKASQARIWRITTLAIVAIVGATFAVVAYIGKNHTVERLSADEACLRSVVRAQSQRSVVLTRLSKRRSDADQARQNWNTREQQLFARALGNHPLPRRVLRREFARANRGYLAADRRYRRLSTLYDRAQQAHPVPQLNCKAGPLALPAPVVTETTTAPAPSPSIVVRVSRVPGPVRTMRVRLPGATVTRPGPVRVKVRTVTVPPGHRHGHGHR